MTPGARRSVSSAWARSPGGRQARARLLDGPHLLEARACRCRAREGARRPLRHVRRAARAVGHREPALSADARDEAPDRREGPREDAADRVPDQHRARRGRRRGRARPRARQGHDRRGRPRRVRARARRPPGLKQRANVVLVPHLGSATVETRERMALRAVANVEAALRGEPVPDDLT